jgi:hypothetical protein
MITSNVSASPSLSEENRRQFTQMLPAIRRQIAIQSRLVPRSQREEFQANALGLACEMFLRLIQRDRAELAYPMPLATYACRQTREGRQCGTSLNVRDLTSRHCQHQTGVRGHSLQQRDPETGDWQELVVEDRQASPADVAATRIDFREWLATLSHKKREIAEWLAQGESTQAVARQFRVSNGRISQLRRELQASWEEFQEPRVPVAA